jgi:hypothetical protein
MFLCIRLPFGGRFSVVPNHTIFACQKKKISVLFFFQQRLYSGKCDFYKYERWDNVKKKLDFA